MKTNFQFYSAFETVFLFHKYLTMSRKGKLIKKFVENLTSYSSNEETFNMYAGNTSESYIKKQNLESYLSKMLHLKPKILFLGEAPGYKGCRLTGIPFTSENILTNHYFFNDKDFQLARNTVKPESEATATIVWQQLDNISYIPLLWNIFPFHPHQKEKIFSNRTPRANELKKGKEYFLDLLQIFEIEKIMALGRKAEKHLSDINVPYAYVRHPANGGKKKFIEGLLKEINKTVLSRI